MEQVPQEVSEVFQQPATRGSILALESYLMGLQGTPEDIDDQLTDTLTEYFAPGIYARELPRKAGDIIIGKIHKYAHLSILLSGVVTVVTEFDTVTHEAPSVFVSQPGIKRAVYAHTDASFLTVHPTDETDTALIEKDIIAEDFPALDAFLKQLPKEIK